MEFKELFFQAWKSDLINVEKNYSDFFELLNDNNKILFNAVLSSNNFDEFSLMRNMHQMSENFNNFENRIQDIYDSINSLIDYNSIMDSTEYQKSVSSSQSIDTGNADQNLIDMNRKLRRENEYLKNEIQKISLINGKLNDDLRSFKSLIVEFKKLEETNNAILTSNSWKITKPLRKFKS